MDIIGNLRPDVEVLREPRGFMRIVQLVLSIFAFGTVTSVQTASHVMVYCNDNNSTDDERDIAVHYGYPFRIYKTGGIKLPFCMQPQKLNSSVFDVNYSSSAEFFCFIGVISFLVYLVLIPAYVFAGSLFAKSTLGAKVDFIVSCVWTVLWFISSAAWADNVSKMTDYMSPENLITVLGKQCNNPFRCKPGFAGDNSTLTVSVLFGFLNMGLSGATLWFLFKETDWHKDRDDQSDPSAYADPGYQTPEYTTDPTLPSTPPNGMQSSFGSQGVGGNDYYNSEPQAGFGQQPPYGQQPAYGQQSFGQQQPNYGQQPTY